MKLSVHDDVAGIRYANSGFDETAGTSDDSTVVLTYAGLNASADIVIDFDNSQTGFAATFISGVLPVSNHAVITSSSIFFNTGFNWFFTAAPVLVGGTYIPIDTTALLVAGAQNTASWMIPIIVL